MVNLDTKTILPSGVSSPSYWSLFLLPLSMIPSLTVISISFSQTTSTMWSIKWINEINEINEWNKWIKWTLPKYNSLSFSIFCWQFKLQYILLTVWVAVYSADSLSFNIFCWQFELQCILPTVSVSIWQLSLNWQFEYFYCHLQIPVLIFHILSKSATAVLPNVTQIL